MEKFIINEKGNVIKNTLLTSNKILVSDENYTTKEVFLEKLNTKKGFLDTHHKIMYKDIEKIIPFKEEFAIQLFFKEAGKNEKTYLELNSADEFLEIKNYLLETTNLSLQKEVQRSFRTWIKSAIYTFMASVITVMTYTSAKSLESGEQITVSGGKRGIKRLIILVAETLGSTNSLIIGIIIVGVFAYLTYNSFKKGGTEIEVYK